MNAFTTTTAATDLGAKAMLASVKIRMWQAKKLDRKVTDETNRAHGAKANAGRYTKNLMDCPELAEIARHGSAARATLYQFTSPFGDNGQRLLTVKARDQFRAAMDVHEYDFGKAADAFAAVYPNLLEQEPARLGDLFNADDYPKPSEIRSRFVLRRRILPMPESTGFRADLPEDERAKIKAEMEADIQETLADAMRDIHKRILEPVRLMAEKLDSYKPSSGKKGEKSEGVFRDSLVDNVSEILELLPLLDVTGSADIASLGEKLKELTRYDAAMLRDDALARAEIQAKAAALAAAVETRA